LSAPSRLPAWDPRRPVLQSLLGSFGSFLHRGEVLIAQDRQLAWPTWGVRTLGDLPGEKPPGRSRRTAKAHRAHRGSFARPADREKTETTSRPRRLQRVSGPASVIGSGRGAGGALGRGRRTAGGRALSMGRRLATDGPVREGRLGREPTSVTSRSFVTRGGGGSGGGRHSAGVPDDESAAGKTKTKEGRVPQCTRGRGLSLVREVASFRCRSASR